MTDRDRHQVHIEDRDGVTIVRLDRPPANAFDLSLTREMESCLASLDMSDSKAIVLTGTGDFFSAGMDLKTVPQYNEAEQREMILAFGRMMLHLYSFPRPTVAAVNGHGVAAGTLLTLACDYRIGPLGEYHFGLTGVKAGIPYPVSAFTIIEAELEPSARRTLLLGAERLSPEQAFEKGIFDELLPSEQVLSRAMEIAVMRAGLPAHAYARTKQQLRADAIEKIRNSTENESDPFLVNWMAPDSADTAAEALDN